MPTPRENNAFVELIHDYVAECLPQAERVSDVFLELERRWAEGELSYRPDASVKGTLHTVKGNSVMMGLVPIHSVAHALEDLFDTLGRGLETARARELAGLLVEGAGLLVDMIRGAGSGGDVLPGPATSFVSRVREFPLGGSDERRLGERREGDRRTERALGARPGISGPDASADTVRVDFRRLDALLEILGETLIAQQALRQSHRALRSHAGGLPEIVEQESGLRALEKTLKRLESALMDTRLLPIATVFTRFTRLVRDVAQSQGKRVRLVTVGGETALDKTILDRLGEPLVHLLTNAVIHGIESPEERSRAGKPAESVLRLGAAPYSDRVVVTVTDDGRGFATERILQRARAQGFEPASAAPEDVHQLVFLPGVSTAETVSNLAGRGVGLDVVASSVHDLGGSIRVTSTPGAGATFTLVLPLTLAVLKALVVEVDGERYVLPLNQVAETIRVSPKAIHEINRQGVTWWREELIHVMDGGTVLGAAQAGDARAFLVVVVAGTSRRGLLVDRLVGHLDVVVKALDPALGKPPLVSGTTILGDGRVACILDVVRLIEQRGTPGGARTAQPVSA